MYSALKKDGKALYEYARKGEDVERKARHITIHKLNMDLAQDERAQAAIKIIVTCSKGTYIRTLGEDIGEAIGCGAHLGSLRRLGTGGFEAGQCVTLAALEAMTEPERKPKKPLAKTQSGETTRGRASPRGRAKVAGQKRTKR